MLSTSSVRLIPCALLLVLAAAGCTTTGASSNRSVGDVLTEEELAEYSNQDAYSAIQRLKPTWLRRRGGSPEVVVDGVHRGGTGVLRRISVLEIEQILYRDPGEATMRYGTGFPYGAIVIETRR